jgi:DNA invertase Pin-like site-specific DNA recombinase
MRKAFSYLRFSTPEQMKGDSLRRQTALATEFCSRYGLELDTQVTYQDLGVSAFHGKNSEEGMLAEFLEAVRSGLVPKGSYLLLESLDRMSRQSPRKALRVLERICEEDITVVTLSDGKQYTQEAIDADPMSLMMSLMIFIRANEESVMKSKRLKAAWVGKRQRAVASKLPLTARCPGWLQPGNDGQFKLIPERAKVVQRIFKEAAQGYGPHKIAEHLNLDKVPCFGSGSQWHRSFIIKLLDQSPAVVGTHVPHVMEHVAGKSKRIPMDPIHSYFPAAIDNTLYQKVRSMRTRTSSPLRGKATVLHNIFGGLVRCSRCGSSMTLQNKGARSTRFLVCSKARYGAGCKYTAVRYDTVESSFLRDCGRILSITPVPNVDTHGEVERLETAIADLQKTHDRLSDAYLDTQDRGYVERIKEAREELDSLRSKLQGLWDSIDRTEGPLVAKRISELRKNLNEVPLNRTLTNASMRALFSGLSINPDSCVATLGWRHGGTAEFVFGVPEEQDQ